MAQRSTLPENAFSGFTYMTFQQGQKFFETCENTYQYKSVVTDLKQKKIYCIVQESKLVIKIKVKIFGICIHELKKGYQPRTDMINESKKSC
jgi:hypothetical protein